MITMDNKNTQYSKQIFLCKKCDFETVRKNDYTKHLLTAKHLRAGNDNICAATESIACECGKKYSNRHNLSRHKGKCSQKMVANENTIKNTLDADMFMELINRNKELQNMLAQQTELVNKLIEREPINNTINGNVTTNNNNNQKFNLNFFLNETCKDAMTIQEFLDSIHITFDDLMLIGNTGFVNGVSDILIKQLRDMEVNKRPIHCTDSKRDTIYLKENAAWNKDDKDKTRLKQIIEKIEYRNVVALRDWCTENPDARVNNTPNNILKDKIYLQTLQGDDKTRDKIIKNISREVTVEKES